MKHWKRIQADFLSAVIEAPCILDFNDRRDWFLDEKLEDSDEWDDMFAIAPILRDELGRFRRSE